MSTHNIGFYEDLTKIIFELSSNTHLISSAGTLLSNKVSVQTDPPVGHTSVIYLPLRFAYFTQKNQK